MWKTIKDFLYRTFKVVSEKAMIEYLISTGKYEITDKKEK